MQAVILAGGKGKRLRPLTDDKPKPMVELLGKPILEYVFAFLPKKVDEVVIVIGYRGDKIRTHFGDEWGGRKVTYVEQKVPKGTAHALFEARSSLKNEPFLVLPGDNVGELSAIDTRAPHQYAIFAYEHEEPGRFGVIELNDDGATLKRIEEKPEHPSTNSISTGFMVLSPDIFKYELVLNERFGEYFIPDLLNQLLVSGETIEVLPQHFWISVDRPEDVSTAEDALKAYGLPR